MQLVRERIRSTVTNNAECYRLEMVEGKRLEKQYIMHGRYCIPLKDLNSGEVKQRECLKMNEMHLVYKVDFSPTLHCWWVSNVDATFRTHFKD